MHNKSITIVKKDHPQTKTEQIRLDKWLWAARFYKTRQLAATAIKANKISLNGNPVKPAAAVNINDLLNIRRGVYQYTINVLIASRHRGSATMAQTLYQETKQSIEKRKSISQQIANQPRNQYGGRKPDKHTIRINRILKRSRPDSE